MGEKKEEVCLRTCVTLPNGENWYVITGRGFNMIKLPYENRPENGILVDEINRFCDREVEVSSIICIKKGSESSNTKRGEIYRARQYSLRTWILTRNLKTGVEVSKIVPISDTVEIIERGV